MLAANTSVYCRFKCIEQVTSQRWWWNPENALRGEEHEKKSGPGNPINSGRKIFYIMILHRVHVPYLAGAGSFEVTRTCSGWKTSKNWWLANLRFAAGRNPPTWNQVDISLGSMRSFGSMFPVVLVRSLHKLLSLILTNPPPSHVTVSANNCTQYQEKW